MKKLILTLFIIVTSLNACKKDIIVIEDLGTLPRLEITIDENYLWSPDSGLYVVGNNFPNWAQSWEYPGTIRLLENNDTLFREDVGIRIKGNRTRGYAMKSWGFYFRGEYGNSFLEYPVFQNRDESTYKRLMARSSGNDFGNTQILDISTVSIIRGHVDFEYQDYKQCVLYLNGSYWGIYNIREMLTKHYFEQYFGFPKENIDFLEGSELNPIADDGNVNSYNNNVLSFIENNDLSDQENYNFIANIIDISSYIDYIIVNTYIGNRDWPNTNIKWWKDRTSSISKWRWAMFDTDMSFQLGNKEYIWIGDLIGQPFPEYDPGAISGSFFIFNNLIKNDEFKERFLNRYLYLIENTFNKERVESLILENKNRIYNEYDNFHLKWPGTKNKTEWEKSVEDIIKFNNFRHDYLKNLIQQLKYDFENQKN